MQLKYIYFLVNMTREQLSAILYVYSGRIDKKVWASMV